MELDIDTPRYRAILRRFLLLHNPQAPSDLITDAVATLAGFIKQGEKVVLYEDGSVEVVEKE